MSSRHVFLLEPQEAAMVLKTELFRFSGAKIYPGRGIRFIRFDSQVFLFINSKCKRYFHNRLKPSKITWIAMFRKQHKKDSAQESVKKKRRATKKPYSRSIVGATLEVIQKRRTEKPEVRDAAREVVLWPSESTTPASDTANSKHCAQWYKPTHKFYSPCCRNLESKTPSF